MTDEKKGRPCVYIAGPMTGLPDYNFPAFHAAAAAWRARGWGVFNPAAAFDGDQTKPYKDYVAYDMKLLRSCDAIAMLPGWDGPTARGSVWEREIALLFGLPVYDATCPQRPPEPARPESALQEAQRLVHGDRGAAYGHPIDDYTRTGRMWGAILGVGDIDPRICCLMMAAVKISREVNAPKRDNRVDLAGYAECAEMVAQRQAEAA